MIQIYPYATDFYPMLESWWKGHGWSPVPAHKLPPFAFLTFYENSADGHEPVPLCFASAYMCNGGTGVAMLEWLVSNPQAPPRLMLKGIRELVSFMCEELQKLDYDTILTACKQDGLSKLYNKLGFETTDTGMIHHLKVIT